MSRKLVLKWKIIAKSSIIPVIKQKSARDRGKPGQREILWYKLFNSGAARALEIGEDRLNKT